MQDKQGYTRACAHAHASGHPPPMHTRGRTRICTNAPTRIHTHTHTFVTLVDFPRQQWFSERALMLRYTYNAYFVQLEVKFQVKAFKK